MTNTELLGFDVFSDVDAVGFFFLSGVLAAIGGQVSFEDTKAIWSTERFGYSCLGGLPPPNCQLFSVHHKRSSQG